MSLAPGSLRRIVIVVFRNRLKHGPRAKVLNRKKPRSRDRFTGWCLWRWTYGW